MRESQRRLLVAAPAERWREVEQVVRAAPGRAASVAWPDQRLPCRIAVEQLALTHRDRAEGLLILVPRGILLEQAVAGAVVHGLPTGLVPVGDDTTPAAAVLDGACAKPGSSSSSPSFAVLAMWKAHYLTWGKRFVRALRQGYGDATVHAWFADGTSRGELALRMARGPDLIIYAGHGRSRGWVGYRGLRWEHLAGVPIRRRAGAVLSLTCDTLKERPGGSVPFGTRWVLGGRCAAFLGAVDAVGEDAMIDIAGALAAEFRLGRQRDLGGLLTSVDARIRRATSPAVAQAWSRFRIVGDPTVPLATMHARTPRTRGVAL